MEEEYKKKAASATSIDVEINPDDIEYGPLIGKGGFGEVFRAKLHGKEVAVKKLFLNVSDDVLVEFRSEVAVMSRLRHPNIILLMGAITRPGKLMIVTDLAVASVDKLLLKGTVSLKQRMQFARDAALGMNWLHRSNPQILHLDLKTGNLLVDQYGTVKVCDFGLSQIRTSPGGGNEYKKYIYIFINNELFKKVVVLLELHFGWHLKFYWKDHMMHKQIFILTESLFGNFTFKRSHMKIISHPSMNWLNKSVLKDIVQLFHVSFVFIVFVCLLFKSYAAFSNFFFSIANCPPRLKSLMQRCWHQDAHQRPSFNDMIKENVFSRLIVEAVISDPAAAEFWFANWDDKQEVGYTDFVTAFTKKAGSAKEKQLSALTTAFNIDLKARDPKVTLEAFDSLLSWFGPFDPASTMLDRIANIVGNP